MGVSRAAAVCVYVRVCVCMSEWVHVIVTCIGVQGFVDVRGYIQGLADPCSTHPNVINASFTEAHHVQTNVCITAYLPQLR